jgi:hypothetical protein
MPSMRPGFLVCSVLLAAAVSLGGLGWKREREQAKKLAAFDFVSQRAEYLQAENARLSGLLADRQGADDLALERRQRGEIERTVADLSGLKFLRPVVYREIAHAELPTVLTQKLSQQVPDTEFESVGLELSALGLIPAGMDLKRVYLALLGEQIGAFYDQHTHELFTFSGHPLTNSQNQVIMAHELTHALQDQHFDLLKLPLEAKGNDDRALAASALVEGDATLVMNQYLTGNLSAAVLRESLAGALSTDVRQLAAAPRYLRETLLFPYLQGLQFVTALEAKGGRAAVSRAFANPPASTSQVMHPERYFAGEGSQPSKIEIAATAVFGKEPAVDNVLGEFTLQQILENWTHEKARSEAMASGWRSDRILLYGDPGGYSYVCRTIWSDIKGADAYCLAALANYTKGQPANNVNLSQTVSNDTRDVKGADFSLASEGREIRVLQRGEQTLLIDAQDKRWANELGKCFALPTKTPP